MSIATQKRRALNEIKIAFSSAKQRLHEHFVRVCLGVAATIVDNSSCDNIGNVESFLKIKRFASLPRLNFLDMSKKSTTTIESGLSGFGNVARSGLRTKIKTSFGCSKNYVNLQNSSRRRSHQTVFDGLNQCHRSSAASQNDTRSHPFYISTAGDGQQFLWR